MKENTEPTSGSSNLDDRLDYRMPIYLQLREIIRSRIDEGEYAPGTAIPSENKLAETFDINRLTVRSAVDALVNEGILRRVQGKGVFVVGVKHEEALEGHGGFVSSMSSRNRTIVKEQTKTLRPAGSKYADYFDIDPDDTLIFMRHFVLIDDTTVSMEEIFVPKDVLPQLEEVNSSVFSLADIFSFYGIELENMRQSMEIVRGTAKTRKLLDTPDGVALVLLTCDYQDRGGRIIAHSCAYIRSDKVSFSIQTHD